MVRGGILPRSDWDGTIFVGAEGDVSLSLTMPDNTVENDLMVIVLAYKGTGWSTPPSGWTSACRDISSTARGEILWKRAGASETGPFVVTGITDCCAACIISLANVIKTGDPIETYTIRANAGGAYGTAGVTTTTSNCVILVAGMSTGNNVYNHTIVNLPIRQDIGGYYTYYGTYTAVGFAAQMMPTPGATGATGYTISGAQPNVGVCLALKPDPTETLPTFDVELTGACTNTTEVNAYELTLKTGTPYRIVESIADGK